MINNLRFRSEIIVNETSLFAQQSHPEVSLDPLLCLPGLGHVQLQDVEEGAVRSLGVRVEEHHGWLTQPVLLSAGSVSHHRAVGGPDSTAVAATGLERLVVLAEVTHHGTAPQVQDGVDVEVDGSVVGAGEQVPG